MNPFNVIVVLALIGFGLYAGRIVAQKSEAKKPVSNNPIAKTAHYLAAGIASVLPLTLCATLFVLQLGRFQAVGVCASLFILEFVLLAIVAASSRAETKRSAS
jgi:uncharacterized membrane protein